MPRLFYYEKRKCLMFVIVNAVNVKCNYANFPCFKTIIMFKNTEKELLKSSKFYYNLFHSVIPIVLFHFYLVMFIYRFLVMLILNNDNNFTLDLFFLLFVTSLPPFYFFFFFFCFIFIFYHQNENISEIFNPFSFYC